MACQGGIDIDYKIHKFTGDAASAEPNADAPSSDDEEGNSTEEEDDSDKECESDEQHMSSNGIPCFKNVKPIQTPSLLSKDESTSANATDVQLVEMDTVEVNSNGNVLRYVIVVHPRVSSFLTIFSLPRILQGHCEWLIPNPQTISSVMSRIITYWGIMKKVSQNRLTGSTVSWESPQVFTITWGSVVRHIALETFCSLIIKEKDDLLSSLKAIVPGLHIADFSLDSIKDHWRDPVTSMFDLPENKAVFQPYIDRVWCLLGRTGSTTSNFAIYQKGQIMKKPARQLMTWLTNLCELILAHFYRTGGVGP